MLWLAMVTVLLLAACGENEISGEESLKDNAQDAPPEDLLPLSDGFEEYRLWIETSDDPGRKSTVTAIHIFENGEVLSYSNFSGIPLENIIDLTDEEIMEYIEEVFNDSTSAFKREGKYTLDITLDRLGQETEKIDVLFENGTEVWHFDWQSAFAESEYQTEEAYFDSLKDHQEIDGEKLITTKEMNYGVKIATLETEPIHQTIYDTTFSGIKIFDSSKSILTRVEHSFSGFTLDRPDTDKENVTIEAAEERKKESEQENEQKQSAAKEEAPSSSSERDEPVQVAEEKEAWKIIADETEYIMELIDEGKLEEAESRWDQLPDKITSYPSLDIEDYNTTIRSLSDMLVAAKYEREQEARNNSEQESSSGSNLKEKYMNKVNALDEMIDKKHGGDVGIGVYGDYYEDWDKLLNEVWGVLEDTMSKEAFEELRIEQRAWMEEKDAEYEKWKDQIDAKDVLTNTTRTRTVFLIENYME